MNTQHLRALCRSEGSLSMVVMIKLRLKGSSFASLPMSNDQGNARAVAFAATVDEMLERIDPDRSQTRLLQRAANVGVFAVRAPAELVEQLLGMDQVQSIDVLEPFEGRYVASSEPSGQSNPPT
ncbi:MAG: hypothetical protein EPO01_21385 [Aquabacterium sp.]|nr:MAG: hypothetical protein EPO12_13625 [Aquabacterium sp.]TAL13485.1 MAG: hypothetical protein EPO01_21385 [Aquabacterium sp.]